MRVCVDCGDEITEPGPRCHACGGEVIDTSEPDGQPKSPPSEALSAGYTIARANGHKDGPFSMSQLSSMLRSGSLSPHELVWTQGMVDWVPAAQVLGVNTVGSTPYGFASAPTVSSQKTRVAYILLGIFLGLFGAHNFYAGYHGRAIAQLLITLLIGWWLILPLMAVGIWVIIEVITVNRDSDGAQML